jgi:hypothetical protein
LRLRIIPSGKHLDLNAHADGSARIQTFLV